MSNTPCPRGRVSPLSAGLASRAPSQTAAGKLVANTKSAACFIHHATTEPGLQPSSNGAAIIAGLKARASIRQRRQNGTRWILARLRLAPTLSPKRREWWGTQNPTRSSNPFQINILQLTPFNGIFYDKRLVLNILAGHGGRGVPEDSSFGNPACHPGNIGWQPPTPRLRRSSHQTEKARRSAPFLVCSEPSRPASAAYWPRLAGGMMPFIRRYSTIWP